MMTDQTYKEPLEKFLTLGYEENAWFLRTDKWPDYVGEYNLDESHIPDLIRLVDVHSDPKKEFDEVADYAAVHAWRALGQLKAEAAIPILIEVLRRDIWEEFAWEEFPQVFALIGEPSIEPLIEQLNKPSAEAYQSTITYAMQVIAKTHPQTTPQIKTALIEKMKRYEYANFDINGFVVAALIDLKATEALPIIKEAYDANHVDETICGTYQEVEVAFGVRDVTDVTDSLQIRRQQWLEEQEDSSGSRWGEDHSPETIEDKDLEKKKKKRAMAQKTKKQNRKKNKKKKK